ncbi:tripartite motif-containing protein 2-like [Branchiostoma lanceolatum]|uniref:tripartite motif-containing protein 2-like n=1 Tax=Branchiostoma lanceolatum TaxID=7740 RepID=UPI0034521689
MATKEELPKHIKDEFLQCWLCLDTFKRPKALPCLHTFCERCLQDYAEERPKFLCRYCRADTVLPEGGVASLPDNFWIVSMKDLLQKQVPNQDNSESDSDMCRVHGNEELSYYCNTCDDVICRECISNSHSQHSVSKLNEVVEKSHTEIRGLLEKGRNKLEEYGSQMARLSEEEQKLKSNKLKVERHVKMAAKTLIGRIRIEKESLLRQIQDNYSRISDSVKENKTAQEEHIVELLSTMDWAHNIISSDERNCKPFKAEEKLGKLVGTERTEKSQFLQGDHMVFHPAPVGNSRQHLGQIELNPLLNLQDQTSTDTTKQEVLTQQHSDVGMSGIKDETRKAKGTTHIPGVKKKYMLGNRGERHGQFDHPRGIAVSTENLILVADSHNGRIQMFDSISWKHVNSFSTTLNDDLSRPTDLAIGSEGNVYVVDLENKCVKVFDYDGRHKLTFPDVLLVDPKSIAVCPASSLLYVTEFSKRAVRVYNTEGKVVRHFPYVLSEEGPFAAVAHVAVNKSGDVIISDEGNNCIKVFSSDGRLKFRIEGEGRRESGSFSWPMGVCVDDQQRLLVADRGEGKVLQFDTGGRFLQHLLTWKDGLKHPYGLDITTDGQMFVTDEGKHCIFAVTFT